jgi:hypothetical protein
VGLARGVGCSVELPRDVSGAASRRSLPIGILECSPCGQEDGPFGELGRDDPREACFRTAVRGIQPLCVSTPDGIETRTYETELTAVGVEHALPGGSRFLNQRVVHEPQYEGSRQDRQQREQDEQPGAAVEPPAGGSKRDGHLG